MSRYILFGIGPVLAAMVLTVGAAITAVNPWAWLVVAGVALLGVLHIHQSRRLRALQTSHDALSNTEAMLRECIEVTPNPVAIYDETDRLVVWSKSYESIHEGVFETLSWPIYYADLMRAIALQTLAPAEVEAYVAQRVQDQRSGSGEWKDRQAASGVWYRVTKKVTPRNAVMGVAIDITEQKRREEELAAQSQVIAEISARIASGTGEESASLQEIVATINDMVVIVQDIHRRTREIRDTCLLVSKEAAKASAALDEAVGSMVKIDDSTKRSRTIVNLVEDIAQQIHVLSINASIEANSAGEHGQGFGVVATEVRNLAERSKRAAENIRDLIEKSEKGVAEGSGSTTRSVSILSDAVVGIERIVKQVEEALERVDAQSQGIEMVASSVESVHQASDDNAQAARDLVARTVGDVAA